MLKDKYFCFCIGHLFKNALNSNLQNYKCIWLNCLRLFLTSLERRKYKYILLTYMAFEYLLTSSFEIFVVSCFSWNIFLFFFVIANRSFTEAVQITSTAYLHQFLRCFSSCFIYIYYLCYNVVSYSLKSWCVILLFQRHLFFILKYSVTSSSFIFRSNFIVSQ